MSTNDTPACPPSSPPVGIPPFPSYSYTYIKPKRRVSFWLAWIFGIFLCLSAFFNFILIMAVGAVSAGREGAGTKISETTLFPSTAQNKIVILPLRGVIMSKTSGNNNDCIFCDTHDIVTFVRESLEKIKKDPSVKGILLYVDSPGGGVTESDNIYHLMESFRRERPILPILAYFEGVAASGAYYVSMAADTIVANPTVITGSIGVIMETVEIQKLLDMIGVRPEVIKSGPKKDILSPFRPWTEEEHQLLQNLLNEMYERFLHVVAQGRQKKLTLDKIRPLADGSIYTAAQAKENGLVDEVGYFDDALSRVEKEAGGGAFKVVEYQPPAVTLMSLLFGSHLATPPPKNEPLPSLPIQALFSHSSPKLLYLWSPGLK